MNKQLFVETPIKAMGDVITGKTPATAIHYNYGTDYMFITPNELHDGYIVKQSEKGLSKKGFTSIKNNTISGISVLVGCIGWDMGNVALCVDTCATNQQINSITNFNDNYNPYYVYYWLSMKKDYLFQIASVTRTPILNKSTFEEILVPMPELGVQNNIVSVLSAIDKKIQLNNRIITELEAMAKTIYDYWFVQFDFPNEEGRPYRSSGGEMVWNEQLKREIPMGWHCATLADIANITMGQSPSGKSYNNVGNGTVFYQGRTDFGYRYPTSRVYTTEPYRMAYEGDVLLSVRAPVGDINIANETCCIGRGLAALNSKIGSNSHLFMLMKSLKPIFDVFNGNGTTYGALTKDILHEIKVAVPKTTDLQEFERIAGRIDGHIVKLDGQNRELNKLRDWLLPMLMNGQVTVE